MSEATKRPWFMKPRNWRNEFEPFDWYISGNLVIDDDGGQCSTGIAIVKGNATSGDIAEKNAEMIVRAVNHFDELEGLVREFTKSLRCFIHGEVPLESLLARSETALAKLDTERT